jgi:DNA mismatch repair protein MutS2
MNPTMQTDAPSLLGLDWPSLLEALAERARTPMGATSLRVAAPFERQEQVRAAHDAIDEVLALFAAGGDLPVGAVRDVTAAAVRAGAGGVLDVEELCGAARTLTALIAVERAIDVIGDEAPALTELAYDIRIDPMVEETLRRAFDASGQLSRDTFPELARLQKQIGSIHEELRGTLERLAGGAELGDVLQDKFWTVRENRYVLPVKSHAKRWDLGIVHGTSGSGRTVFVEPHQVIALNNRLRLAEGELTAEEHRIRAALSHQLGSISTDVGAAIKAAAGVDRAIARATLARDLNASRPYVGNEGVVALRSARHPLLQLRGIAVVANSLELSAAQPVLVISGPNAGGKTVALKTVGCCALLVRHGCFVPAEDGSRMDLFPRVHASIGDHQTVQDDRSSFSAHIDGLVKMLDGAGTGTLLLLDELASGTDPAQGAALGQAVLEYLVDRGAAAVVTTHYAALKGMAVADDRFAVAAMQYLEGRPTYRVLPGVSGESHAFSVAERMGLDPAIVERGRSLLGEEGKLALTLEKLEIQIAQNEGVMETLRRETLELESRAARLALREEKIRAHADALEAKGAAQFLKRLKDAEAAVGAVVADLQRSPEHKRARAARATIDAIRGLVPEETVAPPAPIAVGDRVKLRGAGTVGVVAAIRSGKVQINAGKLRLSARLEELERLAPAPVVRQPQRPKRAKHPKTAAKRTATASGAVRLPGNTLDMRGMRVEEGQAAAETFFDSALQSGDGHVFLLHGHGSGALKTGLRGWLRRSGYVSDWAPGSADQGGDAFTVVMLG